MAREYPGWSLTEIKNLTYEEMITFRAIMNARLKIEQFEARKNSK